MKAPPKNLKPAKQVSLHKANTSARSAKKEKEELNEAPVKLDRKLEMAPKQVSSHIDLA